MAAIYMSQHKLQDGYSEFFSVFQNFYVFILQFLVEPLTMLCGTVVWKH